ncbi:MAG: glycosyltransferase family 10, partial [Bacteroidota bacterium]
MKKTIWNCIGTNFSDGSPGNNGGSSTRWKESVHIKWNFNYESDTSFYIDGEMFKGVDDHPEKRKFGWLLESKGIFRYNYEQTKKRYKALFETYEAIFTHDKELLLLDDRFRFTLSYGFYVKDIAIHPKSKLVSAINSGKTMNDGHRWRNQFIEQHRDRFDLYGIKYRRIKLKEQGLNDYMFSVCIENANYPSYFTEKILDCFATGTIPIYKGSPDIADYFNPEGIIFIDDPNFSFDMLSPELYYSKMDAIKDNFERILPSHYNSSEDYIYAMYKDEFG